MCGIFGFVGKKYSDSAADLSAMQGVMSHRGPDHYGSFSESIDQDIELNFGHVRLSIIDTSPAGNQPMESPGGKFVIIFNGELYNFKEVKAEIEKINPSVQWKGNSDTEVFLAGIEIFGLENCISRLVGMFAFALYDKSANKLFLGRDRIGEKPLYFGYQGQQLIFASELKAFEKHSAFENKLNSEAAVGFLLRSCVPQQLSIYQGVNKVKPGTILAFSIEEIPEKKQARESQYWSLENVVSNAKKNPFRGSYQDATEQLEQLLIQSVRNQSISDVPLGAFLSGGIDSSLVCAIYKKHVSDKLFSFTIGMPAPGADEAVHAEKVANIIGTDHNVKYLTTDEIIGRLDEIIGYWDEPFADSSQIPTFFVSELARNKITVSLSGDGADEFAYGYTDYPIYSKYKKLRFLNYLGLTRFLLSARNLFPGLKKFNGFNKIFNFAYLLKLLSEENLSATHARWRNKFRNTELPIRKQYFNHKKTFLSPVNLGFKYAGYIDALNYLPDDILVKVDRAAMAVSLESRAPFLDHRVLEFLVSLPTDFKFKDGVSKRILKEILYKYVPKEAIDRPKQGFSIPLTEWLRTELKEWAFNILMEIPEKSNFWEKAKVMRLWKEHQSKESDHTEKIWNIIVLQKFLVSRNISF